ncbi:MAG TPA: endonuclease/exonuclease/phosphatase family protein [Candidatus Limnocylindrales bacterium]|nr:endonuclease/exonuclease/phosphatase family protein [Candidatus Limnocylindrales bacterium]
MRLLSYNIRHGGGGREKALAAVINQCEPDVVVLQEAVRPDVVERLSSACGMTQWACRPGYSVAFLSRLEVAHSEWRRSPFGRRHYLELVLAEQNLRIFGVHLSAIHSNVTELRRVYELRSILRETARCSQTFHVLTGDFNTLANGEALDIARLPFRLRAFLRVTGGRVRWRTIKLMAQASYVDAFRSFHPLDSGYTFPTWDPHVRLDYLFAPQQFASFVQQCEVVRDGPVRDASDHFPLLSVITAPAKPRC